jgi:hypothetical protein
MRVNVDDDDEAKRNFTPFYRESGRRESEVLFNVFRLPLLVPVVTE